MIVTFVLVLGVVIVGCGDGVVIVVVIWTFSVPLTSGQFGHSIRQTIIVKYEKSDDHRTVLKSR